MASTVWYTAAAVLSFVPALAASTSFGPARGIRSNAASQFTGCDVLIDAGLSGKIFFSNDTEYAVTIQSYYSGDVQDVRPSCIFKPTTSQQVSDAIKALNSEAFGCWTVAIRSGGHSPFPSNNAANGVTIDLGGINSITYTDNPDSQGHGVAALGPGGRWGEVYSALEEQGVMTTGGREGHVGVGGFLLGGGFSWYSAKYGLSADNVLNYEVVLANGSLIEANATAHADLFKALKGGMNNLGVVTRFDLRTFPANDIYGGIVAFAYTEKEPVVQSLITMIRDNEENPAESGFVSLSWGPGRDPSVAFITANVDGVSNSSSFAGLADLGPLIDTRSAVPNSEFVRQLQGTLGLYNVWFTQSFHATMVMGRKVLEVFEALIADLEGRLDENATIIFVLTPLSTNYANNGPNILGLNEELTEPSVVLQVECLLPTPNDEALLTNKFGAVIDEISEYAARTGQSTTFKYINYAHQTQDPLQSYGGDNQDFLEKVAQTYDPNGFFQHRVSGGFKISKSTRA
ncbi:FAD binding domain-containing protein [Colletotrichum scovillei]|uniref:FAD binding domain-containing protein n=1 Tax=Colletotrichum scovillei TaxID=1209932 RepID=A0A9P7QWZ8_9PEZI|nr:FAD binding domain-containing protein [Colletotrichum scovillei]KAG7046289.1 FAD binding domain-containing protein [Colletotrichum scovillei]KAG7063639.1 FAD binding domain-containing protein [Colletotrichum scovillei]